MDTLLEWLEYVEESEDSRQRGKVRHRLKDILVIVLLATLANADDWVEIGIFAQYHEAFLRKYIRLENGIPSHDTIQRVMALISPDLMQQIMANMEGADSTKAASAQEQNLDEAKRLMDETNERLEKDEDELLDIPREIREKNNELMLLTMQFAYDKLRSNTDEINEISKWIADVRVNLKKNIIKKQNREINNKEMYAYMHDVFGKDMMKLFDVHFDEEGKLILREHLEEEQIAAARVSKE